jgi:hypothetical protein
VGCVEWTYVICRLLLHHRSCKNLILLLQHFLPYVITHTFFLKENFNPFTSRSIPVRCSAMVTTNILLCKMWKLLEVVQFPCVRDIIVLYGFVNSSCRWHLKTSECTFNNSWAMNINNNNNCFLKCGLLGHRTWSG